MRYSTILDDGSNGVNHLVLYISSQDGGGYLATRDAPEMAHYLAKIQITVFHNTALFERKYTSIVNVVDGNVPRQTIDIAVSGYVNNLRSRGFEEEASALESVINRDSGISPWHLPVNIGVLLGLAAFVFAWIVIRRRTNRRRNASQ